MLNKAGFVVIGISILFGAALSILENLFSLNAINNLTSILFVGFFGIAFILFFLNAIITVEVQTRTETLTFSDSPLIFLLMIVFHLAAAIGALVMFPIIVLT
jgi:hypothetical protein